MKQSVGSSPGELNPNFSYPSPRAIEQTRKRGAPSGNKNRLIHGKYTRAAHDFRTRVRAHIQEARSLVAVARRLIRGETENISPIGDIREVPGDAK